MIYTVSTAVSAETIKEQMSEHAKAVGFGVLNVYDFKTLLESKGFPVSREIAVFELCNPKAAQHALDAFAEISVYLPCRLSVYERGSVTCLSTIGIDEMVHAVGVSDEFRLQMQGIFDNLKALMHSWEE